MNVYIGTGRLPSAYQEVEYIQSSGTQYIDTGVSGSGFGSYEIKFNPLSSRATTFEQYIAGATSNYTPKIYYDNSRGTIVINYDPNVLITIFGLGDSIHTVSISNSGIYVDGTFKQSYSESAWGNLSYYVFNSHGEPSLFASMKLYSLKMYTGGTPVRDFVPCYRKSDNVIGLYDLVNKQFYTNSGSGTFTKGADVYTNVLQNAYIGEYKGWEPGANTIAYYPLKEDVLDYSGNNRNLSQGGITLTTFNGVKCGYNNGGNGTIFRGSSNNTASTITVSYWYYSTASNEYVFTIGGDIGGNLDCDTEIISFYANGSNYWTYSTTTEKNKWINIVVTLSGGNMSFYKNGQLLGTRSCSNILWKNIGVGSNSLGSSSSSLNLHGYVSDCILEDKARTAEEISNYYNQTKSNYGL